MLLGLGVFFSSYMAPHELQGDSPEPPMDRFRLYRTAAGWALAMGKCNQPGPMTLQPLILYVEAEFLLSRSEQMNCYLLSGMCMRLMLKMGLHRDPSKLANISQFEGEMRRRMWNCGMQIDLLCSFHMGLPSMVQGIQSDTQLPRNLLDDDFDSSCTELPPSRPLTEYTSMNYTINKATIARIFGEIAHQADCLTPPAYAEVLRLDRRLDEAWNSIPVTMKPRRLEESVTDPLIQIVQRFGLASLYNKSRCVLHRRYLADSAPRKEHDYSRRVGLEAAVVLLEYQRIIYDGCRQGHILSGNGWFVTSLAVHDFLLAAMILYLVIKNEHYETGDEHDWMLSNTSPTKVELKAVLRRSYDIWFDLAMEIPELKKMSDILSTMLGKVGSPVSNEASPQAWNLGPSPLSDLSMATTKVNPTDNPLAGLSIHGT
jgi:hypothetical protein